MSQKTYLAILKGGVFLSFITFFFVFKNLLFPYITSKQLTFNILIEVLTVLWAAFIIKYPEWRPKRSWITYGLGAFFAVVLLTSFTGVDFNLSFWGDVERMLGFFHLIHFYFFYLILITVLRTKADWLILLHSSLAVAVMISIYSYQLPYSTIGNTAYVAGYLIFNMYFAFILFYNVKNWAARSLYIIAFLIMFPAFWDLRNSGSIVGLGISVILLFLLAGALNKSRKVKIATLSVALVSILAVVLVFSNKNSAFVQGNKNLRTLTTLVSANKVTFQTRLISWKAAWQDFGNHPVLGTGYGNYAITFDKFFDAKFYSYSRAETYFDHAHNNLIDIATTTGVLGLTAYLSIFIAVAYYLLSGYRNGKISTGNFILVTALLAAYFIENLAIFDSLVTYVSLMAVLGFVYWLANNEEKPAPADRPMDNKEAYALVGIGLVILAIMYQYNIKSWKMLIGTIEGQRALAATSDLGKVADIYKEALSYGSPLNRDSRSTFIRLVNQGAVSNMQDKQKAEEVLNFAIELNKQNLAYNDKDSLQLMEYSQTLSAAANFHAGNPERASYYLKQAEDAIERSIASSPNRVPPYFSKAQIYLTEGRKDDAIKTMEYSISLNKDYPDGYCQLAKIHMFYKDETKAYEMMDNCIDKGGTYNLYPTNFVKGLINYYGKTQDFPRILALYQRYVELEQNDVNAWVNLAKLYAKAGNIPQAISAAERAKEIDPSVKEGADDFIKSIQQ